jgi:P pilus assembly chaperone PapD
MVVAGHTPERALRRARQVVQIFALCAVQAIAAHTSQAQLAVDHVDLTLDPTSAAQRVGVFAVKNNATAPAQATLTLADWDRDSSGENRFFKSGTGPGSCGTAVSVTPASVRLAPGETQEIRVSIDSAAAAAMHGQECWSIAFVETSFAPSTKDSRVTNYVVRTGVKVYVASASLKRDAEISALHVKDSISLAVHNTGTRHTIASGAIEFRRPDNSLAAKVDVPDLYMLPGATIQKTLAAPKLPSGKYIVLGVIDYKGDDLAAAQLEYEVP